MVQWGMRKSEALELLGGSIPAAADAIGVTYQAVDKWPDELPQRIADRVQAALWRKSQGIAPPSAEQQTTGQGA
jgi:transcriptional repressor of cell division inhibition gene dicB